MSDPNVIGPFISAHAKLHRGDEHLQTLNDAIQEWGHPDSYEQIAKYNPERTVYGLGFKFVRKPDFIRWGLMAGDVLSNYRDALDHLVYGLAVSIHGDPPPKSGSLQFPIVDSDANWEGAIKRNRLHGLSDSMITAIKAAQPCNRTDRGGELLARLRNLSNPDKHQKIHLAAFGVQDLKKASISGLESDGELRISDDPIEDGAPFAWLIFPESHPSSMEVDLRLTARVRLTDEPPSGPALVVVLKDIRDEVIRIVNNLEP